MFMKRKLLTLFALAACVETMFAWSIQIGDLYYNLDETNKTAEVTYEKYMSANNYYGLKVAYIPSSITYKEIEYRVTSIGERAFLKCSSLASVTIPNSVTSIKDRAFEECTSLSSITIPYSVNSIERNPFEDCTSLTSIEVENGNLVYDSRSNCNAIIETASNTLIAGCQNTSIPNSVTSIGEGAFYGCTGLTSVTLNSVTSIGVWAFCNTGLTSLTIPNSIRTINDWVFDDCADLTSLTIGKNVTSIGKHAFSGCTGLTSITCEAVNPPTIRTETEAFCNVDKSIPLYVPIGSKNAYQTAYQWKDFTNIHDVLEPQSVPAVYTDPANSAQKLIRNGKVYILNGNKTYTLTGQEVK